MNQIIMLLSMLLSLLEITIFIECIASWIPQFQGNKFMILVHNITYPILQPFRNLQNRFSPGLPMDFSPIIALFVINIIRRLL